MSFVADRRFSGELVVDSDGRRYIVGFDDGAVVAAASPLGTDAAVRVALTAGLVTSSQVADINRQVAAHPDLDEVDAVAGAARLGKDQSDRLRRRVIAHKAIRGFALERGDFVLVDERSLPYQPDHAIDVRALIYLGARTHMTEQRLLQELARVGPGFQLRADAIATLPQYGFGEAEKPILAALRSAPLAVLDLDAAAPELDPRTVRAIVYSLAVTNALEISQTSVGSDRPRSNTPPGHLSRRTATVTITQGTRASRTSTRITPPTGAQALRTMTPPSGTPAPRTSTIPPRPTPPQRPQTQPPERRDSDTSTRKASEPGFDRTRRPTPTPTALPGAGDAARARAKPSSTPPGTQPAPSRSRTTSLQTAVDAKSHRRPTRRSSLHQIDIPVAAEVRTLIRDRSALAQQGADHFALLGVTSDTAPDQIRKIYFSLARQLHPDRLTALGIDDTDREAQRLFAQINTAFAILSSPQRRHEYSRLLQAGGEGVVRAQQDQAEAMTRKVLAAEEKFRIGEMALRRDQLDVALEHFKQAVELNPEEADHHALLGWTMFIAAEDKAMVLKSAKALLDKAARMSAKAVAPRLYLGRMARMMGRETEARKLFEEVVALAPNHPEATSELRVLDQRAGSGTRPPEGKGGLFGRFRK